MPIGPRVVSLGGVPAAVAVALITFGCGGGSADEASITLAPPPSATAYVVVDPPTTTTTTVPPTQPPAAVTSPVAGGGVPAESPTEYVVRANDSVFAIASRFGLTPEELAAINGWPDGIGQTILPGDTIRIAAAPTPTGAPTPGSAPSTGGGDCPTTYTIQSGDTSRIAVADRFGITFEEMDAANANTPGYSSFVVGTPITIPCPS